MLLFNLEEYKLDRTWKRWENTRSRGLFRFIWIQGVLGWGGFMGVYFLILDYFNHEISVKKIFSSVLFFLIAGAFWGVSYWYWMEWRYKVAKKQ